MDSFETLIVPIDKGVLLRQDEREMSASLIDVRPKMPMVRTSKWQRYKLRLNLLAEFDVTLEFREPTNRAYFHINVTAEVKLSDDHEHHRLLTRWTNSTEGLRERVQERLGESLKLWHKQEHPNLRLLGAVLASIRARGDNMASVDRAILATLSETGFKTDFVRVRPIPAIRQRAIDMSNKTISNIRLSDHDVPLEATVGFELTPLLSIEEHYFRGTARTDTREISSDKLQRSVLDAIGRALGGYRFQQWKMEDPDLNTAGLNAANDAARKFGWKVTDTLLLRSNHATVLLHENFDFARSYALPGTSRKLTIQHNGTYRLIDAARHEQMKRTTPECAEFGSFIKLQVERVTERMLQRSTYGEAIKLVSDSEKLEDDIRRELSEIIRAFGFECASCHVVVKNLPELPLLDPAGYNTEIFEETEFKLAVTNEKHIAKLGLSGRLYLKSPDKFEPAIAKVQQFDEQDQVQEIVNLIAERAKVAIAGFLNRVQPEEFRLSDLSTGKRLDEDETRKHEDPLGEAAQVTIKAYQNDLEKRVAEEIMHTFGIELTNVEFLRGEEPVKARILKLKGAPGSLLVRTQIMSHEDYANRDIEISCTYDIQDVAMMYETQFANKALFFETPEEQIQQLEADLQANLHTFLQYTSYELWRGVNKPKFALMLCTVLQGVAERNHGLKLSIDPGGVTTDVPPAAGTEELRDLNQRIKLAKIERNKLLSEFASETDDSTEEEQVERLDKLNASIGRMMNVQKQMKVAFQEEDRDADANVALDYVVDTVLVGLKSMRVPYTTQELIQSQARTLLGSDVGAEDESSDDEDVPVDVNSGTTAETPSNEAPIDAEFSEVPNSNQSEP